MDFDEKLITDRGYGIYTRLDKDLLPKLYVAYDPTRAEVSGHYHRNLRVLFEQHDSKVVDAMAQFADYAGQAHDCLVKGKSDKLPSLIDANFDLRDSIFNVPEQNRRMVPGATQPEEITSAARSMPAISASSRVASLIMGASRTT